MAITQTAKAVHYPDSDGKPMAETPYHLEAMVYLIAALQAYFAHRQDVYVAGNQFMYWVEGNPRQRVAPDVYVAFGVPKTPLLPTWKVWEVGKAPDVIIEVTSRSTAAEDLGRKYELYQRLGVKEYFLVDVLREYLSGAVLLYRLQGREYVRVLPERANSEEWRVHSEQLGLDVCVRWEEDRYRVRLYDPVSGRYLPTLEEEARRAEEEAQRAEEEARARAEAEARIRQLEEELRRLKGNGSS
ncbi:MAG: Uma2 family endonuclease [Chthonomonadetes bacterium]|nr:Uma2 family endonuclease [Chthonomonadetes bacterium]